MTRPRAGPAGTRAGPAVRTARLGVLALAMINVASILRARNLPVISE